MTLSSFHVVTGNKTTARSFQNHPHIDICAPVSDPVFNVSFYFENLTKFL